MNNKNVFILSSVFLLVLIFQNCGPKVNFKSESSSSQPETAAPVTATSQPRARTPATVVSAPPPPPLTLLQKAKLLCPDTKVQSGINWSKIDWLKAVSNNSNALPPCLIKEQAGLYLVEACSDAGFTSVGSNINIGSSIVFESARNLLDFSFPSSGGDFYGNIMNIENFYIKTSGDLLLNTLNVGSLNIEGSESCVIMNEGDRIVSDAFTVNSSSKLALFGVKVNDVKGKLNFLHMKSPGNGSHEVYIVDTDVKVFKVEQKYIQVNLKNATITNLCTTDNTIIKAAEESGVVNYISDLTDPRCNPLF